MRSIFLESQFKYINLNDIDCFVWAIAQKVIATIGLQHFLAAQLAIACKTPTPNAINKETCDPEQEHQHLKVGSILTFVKIEGQLRPVLVEQW